MRMILIRYLGAVRELIGKGYRIHSSDGAIKLMNPQGELVSPLQAVFTEVTGRGPMAFIFSGAYQLMRMDPQLGDRITEAEENPHTHWREYRAAIQEALGINTVSAA